jgi:low temperature requirement protein LtrA
MAYKSSSSAIVESRNDTDHHDHHGAHHSPSIRHLSEQVPLYSAPRQRQRWNEIQVLPHVNWGDLYFDLFYVSAAYNLSHGFKADPTVTGFLWFVACYLPIFQIWNEKLVFDSRYSPEDNLFHRSLEVVRVNFCLLL